MEDGFLRDIPASPDDVSFMGNSPPKGAAGRPPAAEAAAAAPAGPLHGAAAAPRDAPARRPLYSVEEPAEAPGGVSLDDFVLIQVIGKGSFGKVIAARHNDTGEILAIKALKKSELMRRNQVNHTMSEVRILKKARHPNVVRMRYAFTTPTAVHMALELCHGGELFFHLSKEGRFSEERARFYAAQIVLALEYVHSLGVVYRDLKPENVLLDRDGYVKLTDFGLSKEGVHDNVSAHSFVGTPEYLSPEVLTRAGHGRASDWWSLGALLYEMLTGMPPFYSRSRDRLFVKILQSRLRMPRHISAEAASLLGGLLNRDVAQRLGSGEGDAAELKAHPFFRGMDWDALLARRIPAPFRPVVRDVRDTSNFDAEFTSMALDSAPTAGSYLGQSVSEGRFYGFSYCDPRSMSAGGRVPGQAVHAAAGDAGLMSPADQDMKGGW